MVLAAMANPPEHDFAPSWLKIPSDQQKRGQKLGASSLALSTDQWSSGNKSSHIDDAGHSKSRHRHYSSSDSPALATPPSSHQSGGGYGGRSSSVTSTGGAPPGGYGYRGRETDRRHYPRPGSGSRHHSVDDLNSFHDYGGWNIPQYNGGFYANYPRRGGSSSAGLRDGFGGTSRYGDVFHPGNGSGGGGRGYYGSGGRGGSAGRQRYNSGSRAGYSDRDNHPDGSSSSHGGESSDVSGKKKEGTDHETKNSALSSNDFPSLIGDNSKTSDKVAAKTSKTPGGVWDKPPGAAKVQISGRKVQLIKKSIHNDLPPRDPSASSAIKSSSKAVSSSGVTSDGSKVSSGGHLESGTRGSRSAPPGSPAPPSSSSSSINGGYKSSPSAVSQKSAAPVKVHDSSNTSSSLTSPKLTSTKPSSKDTNLSHSPKSMYHAPSKATSDVPTRPHYTTTQQPTKLAEKKTIETVAPVNKPAPSRVGVSAIPESSPFVSVKNGINKTLEGGFASRTEAVTSKAGPGKQQQAYDDAKAAAAAGRTPSGKPVIAAAPASHKPGTSKQVGGKVSPTKPVLVQKATTVAATTVTKPTIKPMSVKNTNGKPVLKESPIRPVPMQIKSTNNTKFSGKESSPIRPFPVRLANQKQSGNRDRSVRPGPVQIRSSRLIAKETPSVRPVPVHVMTRKPTAKDNPNIVDAMASRPAPSSGPKEKQSSSPRVSPTKEPSTNPTCTHPPVATKNARFSHNMNVNNCDSGKGSLKSLQNGGDNWTVNGPLRIEDAQQMNGPQRTTRTETDSTEHITTNGLDNNLRSGLNNLQLSSSLEAEKRLLQEMGWHEHSDNEEGYAPITEDEMKEFQRRSQQLKTQRNGITRNLPVGFLSSSLPSTPMTSIDLDDALSSCSSDSSDDDL